MKQEIKERVERMRKGEVSEGYKKTKVGIIPDDWGVTKLRKHVKTYSGGTPDRNNPIYYNGEIPWIKSGELNKLNIYNTSESITQEGFKNSSAKYIEPNTLLFAMYGATAGVTAFSRIKATTNQAILALITDDLLNKYYLNYWFVFNKEMIIFKYTQGGQPNLSSSLVGSFKIPLPSFKKQQQIAEILSTWDKAIELKEKLIEEKKELKRGLMQKLLTGKMRFPEFTSEWKTAKIKDVFEEVKRINGNSSKAIDILTISAKHGFLSQKDKFNRVIAGSSLKKYTHLFQNEFAYNKGNSKTAPFGCIFKLDMKEGLVPFVYICFSPIQMIDVDFFNFYFKHGLLDRQLKRIITSGARSDGLLNVSKDGFFNIKISSPSIEEQKKIGLVLRLIQDEIDYLMTELNQLKEQKRSLMQLLLTGIVRVEVD